MIDDNKLIDKEMLEEANEASETEDELEQVLDSVPPEHRKKIERMIISTFQMRSFSSSPEAAVMKKITSEHITKFLDGSEQEMKNSYDEKLHRKIFIFLTMIIAMIFFIVVIVLLKETPDTMENIIYIVCGTIGGAIGGYGLGRSQRED